jgi:phospholipase D1/2
MAALADVVGQVMENEKHGGSEEDTHSSPVQRLKLTNAAPRRSGASYNSASGSPAARTGPPNSFFFPLVPLPDMKGKHRAGTESDAVVSNSHGSETPRMVINEEDETSARLSDPYRNSFVRTESGFRSGWEYEDHDSTGRGTARLWDRQSWLNVEDWNINPRKWLGLSEIDMQEEAGDDQGTQPPRQTDSPVQMGGPSRIPSRAPSPTPAVNEELAPPPPTPRIKSSFPRSLSLPHIRHNPAWSRFKSLIPHLAVSTAESTPEQPRSPRDRDVEITDELTFSGLSVLMLRMWLERDERDERRVPILLHRLKIRVSDSVNPLNNNSAVFRIECEYANSAAKWVIYRQLRDFNSLHTHYKVTNFYTRNMDLPDFPRTKLGRQNLHRLKKEKGRETGKKEFAKMRREELENYLAGMIKAVVCLLTRDSTPFIHRSPRCSKRIAIASCGSSKYPHYLSPLPVQAATNLKQECLS